MRDYSPKRRTALVLTGSGASGAYLAGALQALDESGVKVDVVVGSGAGAVAAAFSAVAGSARLYGPDGFWKGLRFRSLYALDPMLRAALLLLGIAFVAFLLPVVLALLAGLLFPLVLLADAVAPGQPARLIDALKSAPGLLRGPYLAALAVPSFALSTLATAFLVPLWLRDRRRFAERFESILDVRRGRERLSRHLWEVSRGPAVDGGVPTADEISRRYGALLLENLGQPGFRELVLRVADLDTGGVLAFALLQDPHRATFLKSRVRTDGTVASVDLRVEGYARMLFDAVFTGLLPPIATPVHRITFPKGGLFPGETHRITDATLAAGCGISEALAAGAEQIILVAAAQEGTTPPPRRRGPRALVDGILATLERQAVEMEVRNAERINRMVETVGHKSDDGRRGWQDPATGRTYREFGLWVIRPEQRSIGPLELDEARHPATEVLETPEDLLEQGHLDTYRLFVEPIVGAGAAPEPRRQDPALVESRVEL